MQEGPPPGDGVTSLSAIRTRRKRAKPPNEELLLAMLNYTYSEINANIYKATTSTGVATIKIQLSVPHPYRVCITCLG